MTNQNTHTKQNKRRTRTHIHNNILEDKIRTLPIKASRLIDTRNRHKDTNTEAYTTPDTQKTTSIFTQTPPGLALARVAAVAGFLLPSGWLCCVGKLRAARKKVTKN